MPVTLHPAGPENRAAIEGMMQLYIHDFSEQWFDQARGELGEDGAFPPYPLDPYWSQPDYWPYLIRKDGHLAGFALVNKSPHLKRPTDAHMGEFFVLRKHRRGGTGTVAAQALFALHPGAWEVAVARRNVPALPFWRGAIESYEQARDIEMIDVDDAGWTGPIFRFVSA